MATYSRQQRAALSHPCLLAEETMHPRFFSQTAGDLQVRDIRGTDEEQSRRRELLREAPHAKAYMDDGGLA